MSHMILDTVNVNRTTAKASPRDDSVLDLWTALSTEREGVRCAVWEVGCYQRALDGMAETVSRVAYAATAVGFLAHMLALALERLQGTGWTVAPMMAFLCLALLPSVWAPAGLAFLKSCRRNFAICAGLWMVLHAYLATGVVLAQTPEGWISHWSGLEAMMGFAALLVLAMCIPLTGLLNRRGHTVLGRVLRSALWLIPTLGFLHGWFAGMHYSDNFLPPLALVLPVALLVLVPAMAFVMGRNMRDNLIRLSALLLGTGLALTMVVLLAPVGSTTSIFQ